MAGAALVSWLMTMFGGAYLFGKVSRFGRHPDEVRHSRLSTPMLLSHGGLALAGLAVWVAYVQSGEAFLAWIAVAIVALVGVLGMVLLARSGGRDREVLVGGEEGAAPERVGYAEHELPKSAVVAHGVLAALTALLVLLAAISA